MKIYGDTTVLEQEGRFGERTVHATLRECFEDDADWLAVYGMAVLQLTDKGLAAADTKYLTELDFLVVNRKLGVLLIEVKGGQLRCRDQRWQRGFRGQWEDLDRSPMQQAIDGLHALLYRANATPAIGAKSRLLLHAPLVAFPAIERLDPLPSDLSHEVMALKETCCNRQDMQRWLSSTFARLQAQHGMRSRESAVASLTDHLIMPATESSYGVQAMAKKMSVEDSSPYVQPGRHDDFVRERELRRRVLVHGPAGSGKTIVGMIRAARLLHGNPSARALIMSYNHLVATRTSQMMLGAYGERAHSDAYHVFAEREVKRAGLAWDVPTERSARATFYRETAPDLLLAACEKRSPDASEKFDLVVVDEAQDFNWRWLVSIEPYLKPGAIRWAMYDPQQFIFGTVASESVDLEARRAEMQMNLANEFGEPDRLLRSYRMSRSIFDYLVRRGLMPSGVECDHLAYEGNAPIEEEVPVSQAAEAVRRAAAHAITALGIPPQQVLVQTKHRFENLKNPLAGQLGRFLDNRYRLVELPGPDQSASDGVPCVTISRYKGCERAATIVVESPNMSDDEGANLLYTALTRARLHLHVIRLKDLGDTRA